MNTHLNDLNDLLFSITKYIDSIMNALPKNKTFIPVNVSKLINKLS